MKVVDSLGNVQTAIMGIALSGMATSVTSTLILSGMIASGQVAGAKLQNAEFITSGYFASGSIMGQMGGGAFNIISGSVGSTLNAIWAGSDIGSGGILEANLSSGIVDNIHFVNCSGLPGQFPVNSGTITTHSQFNAPFYSGTATNLITAEPISGGKAVHITNSGTIRIAMPDTVLAASNSGRMPAIGIVMDNVASGRPANVYTHGTFQFTSGLANYGWNGASGEYYSGQLGRTLLVGLSGNIVCFQSGVDNSLIIMNYQRLGVVINSGGFICNVDASAWSGSLAAGALTYISSIL